MMPTTDPVSGHRRPVISACTLGKQLVNEAEVNGVRWTGVAAVIPVAVIMLAALARVKWGSPAR